MGEWKAQVSIRVRQDLRRELEEWALKERRKLGNVGEVLLEWSFEQLKASLVEFQRKGSTEALLRRRVPPPRNPDGDYRRKPASQRSPAKAHAENGV